MSRIENIGNTTLYLGDCREFLPTFAPGSVDFIFTDPPYGHNNTSGDSSPLGRPIANDGAEANDLAKWFFHEANRLLLPGCCCCCCCCGGGGPDPQFARWSLWLDEAIGFKQMVVWDKGPMGMGWHYRRSYETVLVGEKPGAACRWYDTSNAVENVIRPGKINKIIPAADQHPTAKDASLPLHFIRLHSRPGDLVLDPFMGAGSTMKAALHSGRRFTGVEIEPRWFDECCRMAEAICREDVFLAQDARESYDEAVREVGKRVKAGCPLPDFFLPSIKD
jgi:site-specific DNA-methyltransferase (adenine-specific)